MKVNAANNPLEVIQPENTQNSPPPRVENPALKKVAKQWESVFLGQMISAMRKTVQKGGLIPESQAERVYQDMLDTRHAESMADSEQIGLAKVVYEQLLRSSAAR